MSWATIGDAAREATSPPPESARDTIPRNMNAITSFAVTRWEKHATTIYGASEDAIAKWRSQGLKNIERLHKYAESPIERALAPWLIFDTYCHKPTPEPAEVFCPKDGLDIEAIWDPVIIPQFAFVKYRADFAVVAGPPANRRHIVVVECDGEEVHGGAAAWSRDTKRDGLFACFGIETVRASGAEIYTAPLAVMRRVNVALSNSMERKP